MQDEQHSETKRRRKEELVDERRRQQKELERASVCFLLAEADMVMCLWILLQMTIRHRNMLQAAGFLRTKVEPVLVSLSWSSLSYEDF